MKWSFPLIWFVYVKIITNVHNYEYLT
uniref:Uncharacterized protein n=1 Tax=Anguilla anguilla TaxID=7936 RepID=A0A0E9VZA6_ANGAN